MTEKSMRAIKGSSFTFWVPMELTKVEIKNIISKTFGVTVLNVHTLNMKGGTKKNNRGKVQRIKSGKKAIVTLKPGEKIDLFEEEKKKAKKTVKKEKTQK